MRIFFSAFSASFNLLKMFDTGCWSIIQRPRTGIQYPFATSTEIYKNLIQIVNSRHHVLLFPFWEKALSQIKRTGLATKIDE